MRLRRHITAAVWSITVLSTLQAIPAHAQENRVSEEEFGRSGILTLDRFTWKARIGDSLAWSSPDYDDTSWTGLSRSRISSRDPLYDEWPGMGWFRTTFVVDSLQTSEWVLETYVSGAAEFYLDGNLVSSQGTWGASRSEEVWRDNRDQAIPIEMLPGTHVLAVRYSNHTVADWLRALFKQSAAVQNVIAPGFSAVLRSEANWVARKNANQGPLHWSISLLGAALLTIGVFGLVIQLRSSAGRELLFLSLQPLLLGSLLVVFTFVTKESVGFLGTLVSVSLLIPLFAGSFIAMALAIFEAYAMRWKNALHRMAAVSGILVLVTHSFTVTWISVPALVLVLLLLLFALVLLVRAAFQKKQGAWVLCAGFVISVSGIVLVQLGIMEGVFWNDVLLLAALISFPPAVIYYFAVRFSISVQQSQSRLEENNRLIREKQQLIEGQNEQLERQVEARTAELKASQAQLIEQEKLASLGSLTAGIAHEIKNPLNFVNNFAEVGGELADELAEAIEAGNTEEAQQILEELKANATQIAKHGKRADSIVQGMMQHARGGASDMETVVVNDFLEEYANLAWHGRRARDHGFQAEIKRDFDPEAGSIEVMPQELGRVVLNLLNNAFDAVKDTESAQVAISSHRDAKGVTISVADNGPGVPEDVRQKIFEPFFTTKATGEGTGLGLSLSYDIVTKGHGGSMTISDSPDGGALFTIHLPASA